MAELDASGLEILDRAECLRLLRAGGVARIAWADGDRPIVRPVNFALDGDRRLVIRTGEGGIHAAAHQRLRAAVEVDSTDNVDHRAWSVLVDGVMSPAGDPAAMSLPLRAWAPDDKDNFVQISIDEISGRRIGGTR